MRVLVYGINFAPELSGIGKYSGEMVEWLVKKGYDVRVVTAPPYYPEWRVRAGYLRWWYSTEIWRGAKVYRCPLYIPANPRFSSRLVHLASFALTSFWIFLWQARWKPQLVLAVLPTQFCIPGALALKLVTRATVVAHVQDFELDAAIGLKLKKQDANGRGSIWKLALRIEKFLLNKFDFVSTISTAMMGRAAKKGVEEKKLILFPNWSEVERFTEIERSTEIRRKLSVPEGYKLVLYSGNLGEKQGLECIVEAAIQLRNEKCWFAILGDGAARERLQNMARTREVKNITFGDLVSYELLPQLLATADVHLVVQKRGVADAVLPSKLTNILAVGGHAVITADSDTELGQLCVKFPGIAELVTPEDSQALVAGIKVVLTRDSRNLVAQRYASEFLEKEAVLNGFFSSLTR